MPRPLKTQRVAIKMFIIAVTAISMILYQQHLSKLWILLSCQLKLENEIEIGMITVEIKDKSKVHSPSSNCSNVSTNPSAQEYLPPLHVITPTYKRPEQLAELTRLAHTLMLVPNLRWLVIEDAETKTPIIAELLKKTGLQYEHLLAPMPAKYKRGRKIPRPKGVSNRNRGLQWIRANATDGVLYFADDDNTYDLEIFREMRFTKRLSMWPVGLVTKLGISSPVVKNGAFAGFYDGWIADRKYPVDMAGFAVSVKFFLARPRASMPYIAGYEEDGFLRSLQPFQNNDIELLASNCTKVLVWHTQAKKYNPAPPLDFKRYGNTNIATLRKFIV